MSRSRTGLPSRCFHPDSISTSSASRRSSSIGRSTAGSAHRCGTSKSYDACRYALSQHRRYSESGATAALRHHRHRRHGHYFPKFIEESLGAKFQIVLGYPGNRDVEVAIERGEVHCYAITKEAFLREPGSWLKKALCERWCKEDKNGIRSFPKRRPSMSSWKNTKRRMS